MSEFTSPGAAGGNFSIADAEGHLVVVDVHSYEQGVVTSLGEKDAISATVHDIDAAHTSEDALIFPKVLVGSLKARVGQKVLARVGKGVAKPGQNAPWILEDASGDAAAVAAATEYLKKWDSGQFTAPAETATAPVATPAPAVDLSDPNVVAALAALQAQGLTK